MKLSDIADSSCACPQCSQMCRNRACWPTPEEAQRIINHGFGARLMNDYWAGDLTDNRDVQLLCPAERGCEGQNANAWPGGRCTFHTDDGLCELHPLGLKPSEGRKASCKSDSRQFDQTLHGLVAASWDNPQGEALVAEWWKR